MHISKNIVRAALTKLDTARLGTRGPIPAQAMEKALQVAFEMRAKEMTIEGNKGGSYITITQTDREDVVRLEVGHDCVTRIDQEINVWALAAILSEAKDRGLRTVAKSGLDDLPAWAEPV